jgi:hypothetical protein
MPDQPRTAAAAAQNVPTFFPPLCATLLEIATPQLYLENPFRKTGLKVLAGPREVAKRIDQLKLSAELGGATEHWSFAPEKALTIDELRTVAQVLKEPEARLVHELFWFWPEKYPEDDPADIATGLLAKGETQQVIEYWEDLAIDNAPVALHNLAVLYHHQALELDRLESPADQDLPQLWLKAIRSWDRIRVDEAIWARLRARVTALADARVPMEMVGRMRTTVPDALGKICAALALSHGEQGRAARGGLHAALVMHIHGGNTDARRALETRAAPIARRIDARVNESKNRESPDDTNELAEAMALIRANDDDLHLIEILCGRTAEYYREISQSVADTALNCVVSYQRRTGDDCGCLAALLHLVGMETTPELKLRLSDTYRIVHGNAISGQHRIVPERRLGPMADEIEMSDYEKDYALLKEHVIPALQRLQLGKASRAAFSDRVAGMLKDLAFGIYRENDNFTFAVNAFATAMELPCSPAGRLALENDRAKLQNEFETRKGKELRLEAAANVLQINAQGIDFNGRWVAAADLAALRHKVEGGGGLSEATYVISWRTNSGAEFELNRTNLLAPSDRTAQDYARILDAIYFFFVPDLVDRLVAAIRRGEEVLIGETPVKAKGMVLASPARFGARDELVAYSALEFKIEDGQLSLSSRLNPWLSDSYVVADTWNAVIFQQLIEAVQRE